MISVLPITTEARPPPSPDGGGPRCPYPPPMTGGVGPTGPTARVRIAPPPLRGCSLARRPYMATVLRISRDARGPVVEVRDERAGGLHFARPAQIRVVPKRRGRAGPPPA